MQKFGIDISYWQGNYNLNKAKAEGVEFVIIKGGGGDDGLYKDSKFENNYKKAKGLGLPVGTYWFSRAVSIDDAIKEAEFYYKKVLKGKQFELPIFIDVEAKMMLRLSKRKLTDVIKAWCNYLEGKGYYVGIYSSLSCFGSNMYDAELKRYAHWVAQWNKKLNYAGDCGVWQFGGETNYIRSNKVAGQVTDQNYLLVDYPTIIKKKGLNGFSKTPTPAPTPAPTPTKGLDLAAPMFDAAATKALQKWIGTIQDGKFNGQVVQCIKYIPNIGTCIYTDDYIGSPGVKAWQNVLKNNGFNPGTIDGVIGIKTVKAWQQYLNAKIGAKLTVDGIFGAKTSKASKQYLNKVVYGI